MNKGVIVVITIAIVAALGSGAYFFTKNQSESTETGEMTTNQTANQNTDNSPESYSGTLASLLSLGKDYTCTFDTNDSAGNRTNGTVYVAASGDKFSGSFDVFQLGQNSITTNVMRDGTYNYIWTSVDEDGIKTKIEGNEVSFFGKDRSEDSSVGVSDGDTYNFDCRPWSIDNSKFVPPHNINFTDLSAKVGQVQEQIQEALQSQCATCEQISNATARNVCLQNLGCN